MSSPITEAIERILTNRDALAAELTRRARAIEAAPDPSPSPGVIITEDAERELFACVARRPFDEDEDAFFLALERADARALARNDGRIWLTQTMRRFRCRLHFYRSRGRTFLVACVSI